MAIELKSQAALTEVREVVVDGWKDMKQERSVLEQEWKRCLMAFLCTFDKRWAKFADQANRSHRYVALTWDAVMTLSPQIVNAAMGAEDWMNVVPFRPGFDESDDLWSENMRYLLQFQMNQSGFKKTAKIASKSLAILGNCPCATSWHVERKVDYARFTEAMNEWSRQTAEYNQEYAQIGRQYLELARQHQLMNQQPPPPPQFLPPKRPPKDMDIVFQGPRMKIGSIFNYVQEQHPNEETSALRIMRSWRTKAYLKEMAKPKKDGYRLYSNLDKIKDMESEDRQEDNDAEHLMKSAVGMQLPHNKDKVHLKEMHGTFEIATSGGEKGIYKDYIVVVANDNTVIRCEPSPMFSGRPMIWNARLGVIEGAVYGIGPIEKALDEQDSANAIHNQTIDAVNTVIQPEMEVLEDGLVDGVMKPSGPGVKHYVTESGVINPIIKNYQGVPLGQAELAGAIARHERITGALDTSSGSDETATRTARNTNLTATKLGEHVEGFEDEYISEGLTSFMEMNAQYLTNDQVFQITQDKKILDVEIPLSQIRRGGFVIAKGSQHLAEKEQRIQDLMMALQLAEQREANGVPSPINSDILWRQLMTEILGEAGEVVKSKDEYREELAMWQQQQRQQAMMEAANAGNQQGSGAIADGQSAGPIGAAV